VINHPVQALGAVELAQSIYRLNGLMVPKLGSGFVCLVLLGYIRYFTCCLGFLVVTGSLLDIAD